VGDIVSFLRAPDAGNPHVRCDEREQETEPCQTGLRRRRESSATGHREATATAPVLDSTLVLPFDVEDIGKVVERRGHVMAFWEVRSEPFGSRLSRF